jgi:hypothetical protein
MDTVAIMNGWMVQLTTMSSTGHLGSRVAKDNGALTVGRGSAEVNGRLQGLPTRKHLSAEVLCAEMAVSVLFLVYKISLSIFSFNCSPEIPSDCITASLFGERFFTIVEAERNFEEAEAICGLMGGHLARVHSEAENNFLQQLAGQLCVYKFRLD